MNNIATKTPDAIYAISTFIEGKTGLSFKFNDFYFKLQTNCNDDKKLYNMIGQSDKAMINHIKTPISVFSDSVIVKLNSNIAFNQTMENEFSLKLNTDFDILVCSSLSASKISCQFVYENCNSSSLTKNIIFYFKNGHLFEII